MTLIAFCSRKHQYLVNLAALNTKLAPYFSARITCSEI